MCAAVTDVTGKDGCEPSPVPEVPKPGKPLSSLPAACRAVLTAPNLHAAGSAAGDHRQTH
jgi:hypothetical protein